MLIHQKVIQWFSEHQNEIDAVVFDIDGVLTLDNNALPGSHEFVRYLRSRDVPLGLLTNDGNNSVDEKTRMLRQSGFDFVAGECTSSGHGLIEIARGKKLVGKLLFLMGKLGEPCYAKYAGIRVTRIQDEISNCDGVVVGEEDYPWEQTINAVVNYFVAHPSAPFIVPNPDAYFTRHGGKIQIAAGGVAQFVKHVLHVHGLQIVPIFLGKPHSPIFLYNHENLEKRVGKNLDRRRVFMLGDSLKSDIAGAIRFGYRNGLVLTGITSQRQLESSPVQPELVFRTL